MRLQPKTKTRPLDFGYPFRGLPVFDDLVINRQSSRHIQTCITAKDEAVWRE